MGILCALSIVKNVEKDSFPKVSKSHFSMNSARLEPSHRSGNPTILTLFLCILFSISSILEEYLLTFSLIAFFFCFSGLMSSSIRLILPSRSVVLSLVFCASCRKKCIYSLMPFNWSDISNIIDLHEITAFNTSFKEGSSSISALASDSSTDEFAV